MLHQAGKPRMRRRVYARAIELDPALRARAEQPGRRALSRRRYGGRDRRVPHGALEAAGVRDGAAQPGAAALQAETAPAGARGLSPGARRPCPSRRWRGTASASCWSSSSKFEDARNAFGRAIQARPAFADAHYNLSFTLSNLGDFDGALRATKRALELDPFYVAQKFELTIDLQYEDPDLSIAPDLDGAQRAEGAVETFSFDPKSLDTLFSELTQHTPVRTPVVPSDNPYAMGAEYLAKGMLDRASSEINRALGRGGDAATGLTMLGDVFARQGFHGEALERYRQARSVNGTVPRALAGETRALLMLQRAAEARDVAEQLLAADPLGVESLLLVARARAETGESEAALELLRQAQRLAPGARGRAQTDRRHCARGRRRGRRDPRVPQRARSGSGLRGGALRSRDAARPTR